ncbi:NAD(P)H-binding protein [Streptomyces humi]|uniref:NAD(P)H-binding protein n=1 Tax=Streptomyces humi TaxID=1428620 RepID=UPI0006287149|nr:NAD(P)H-binding protein [Streptomyces humi]
MTRLTRPSINRVLVIGGTGSIGRLVAARLLELGRLPRVLSRDPDRARRSLPDGVEVVAGELADQPAVRVAVAGVDAVVMTHGAPYGSGDYAAVDYGAVPAVLDALDGHRVPVVLMSSIGVTAAGGQSRELLEWKRRGERLLRAGELPYTIVRPGWFDAGSTSHQAVDLRQGDQIEYGPVRRDHVAETIVQALLTPSATGRTVEVFSADGPALVDWPTAFQAAEADRPGDLDGARDRPGPRPQAEPERVRADLRRHAHTPLTPDI